MSRAIFTGNRLGVANAKPVEVEKVEKVDAVVSRNAVPAPEPIKEKEAVPEPIQKHGAAVIIPDSFKKKVSSESVAEGDVAVEVKKAAKKK